MDLGKERGIFYKDQCQRYGKGDCKRTAGRDFQRFYREPEVHDEEGIGVGLYLAREIISMQEGYIEVVSEAGAEFRFSCQMDKDWLKNNRYMRMSSL